MKRNTLPNTNEQLQRELAESKKLEQELLDLSSRQEAILAAVPDVIMEVDNHKIYTWANQAGFAFFGDDVIGKEAAFYFVGEQATYTAVQPQFDGLQDLINVQSWQRRKDGEKRLLAWQCRVLKDESGNVTGALSSARDITEQNQVAEERNKMLLWQQGINLVQQSLLAPAPLEDKLRHITDSIVRFFGADFCRIWLIRPGDLCERGCVHAGVQEGPHACRYRDQCLHLLASSGRYTHIDGKAHCRVPYGAYKIGRIASDEDHKFLTNDVTNDPRVHNHEWTRELELVSFAGYQLRIPGAETLGVLALFSKHPILPAEDALLDSLSSTLALTIQQAQGEEALRKSEFFMNKLLETIPVPVFYKDREGRYLGFNKAFETLFGKSRKQLIGKSVFDISPPELAKVYHAKDVELLEKPCVQMYDSQVRDAHGAMHDVIFHKASLTDTHGAITGLIGAILDVTERKHAEEELQRYSAELEKSNNELKDALANIKQLTGMLPICASCKQIRDDKGYWKSVESYISEHSEAVFSHGICPECEKKMYEDLDILINENI
ncbi:MAG: PAS domain S-box protein [Desulfatirhabdiaceae bacterium]